MPAPYVIPDPKSTPYEYIGEPPGMGSLHLTMLARSYEELDTSNLSDLFPTQMSPERTIVIETIQEGMRLMPVVRPGIPAGNFLHNSRVFRRIVEPAHFREDDFIDQYLINQLKQPGLENTATPPQQIIQERVRRMVNGHNRIIDLFRIQCLLGGIDYYDPRTNVAVQVPTQIPLHNFFKYDGYNASVSSGSVISWGGTSFTANSNLTDNKGRPEALLFTSADMKAGVPWTDPNADLVRTLRLIKQYLRNTNKNVYTDMYMSGDLYTILQENNFVKSYSGSVGFVNYSTGSGTKDLVAASANNQPPVIGYGPGGDINQIAGLNINLVDHLYPDPNDDNKVKNMWPTHKVVIVAKTHVNDSSQPLGFTQHCVGESPEGTPGLWMRTGPDQNPPMVPGRTMQMGDAFLPFAMYPQWICVLDVCDPADIDSKLILRSDLHYGTFGA